MKQKSKCRQMLLGKLCPVDILKNHPKKKPKCRHQSGRMAIWPPTIYKFAYMATPLHIYIYIFFFFLFICLFFLLGGGEGGVEAPGRGEGVCFLLKIPGGVLPEEGEGGGGRAKGGLGGCLRGIWRWGGGGYKFFQGRNAHQVF